MAIYGRFYGVKMVVKALKKSGFLVKIGVSMGVLRVKNSVFRAK